MPRDEAVYRDRNSVLTHVLTNGSDVDSFIEVIKMFLKKVTAQTRTPGGKNYKKPTNLVISVVTGEDKFGPMVDTWWACGALPCSMETLRHYLKKCKTRLDPPIYRRVRGPKGNMQRIRLLSLHDLRVLRGEMILPGPGKSALKAKGEIL